MDKSMIIGIVAGAVGVTAVGGFAGYQAMKNPDYAEVISAKEVTEKVRTPRKECRATRLAAARVKPWRPWQAQRVEAMPVIRYSRTCRNPTRSPGQKHVAKRFMTPAPRPSDTT